MKSHGKTSINTDATEKSDLTQPHEDRPDWHPYKVWQQQIKSKQDEVASETEEMAPANVAIHASPESTGTWSVPQFQVSSAE